MIEVEPKIFKDIKTNPGSSFIEGLFDSKKLSALESYILKTETGVSVAHITWIELPITNQLHILEISMIFNGEKYMYRLQYRAIPRAGDRRYLFQVIGPILAFYESCYCDNKTIIFRYDIRILECNP